MSVPLRPAGVQAVVIGDVGNGAHQPDAVREAYAELRDIRLCGHGIQPDQARVQGSASVEVSVQVDEFSEFVLAACALDPVAFVANAALQALRQMEGGPG
jgi:hypothetical protein